MTFLTKTGFLFIFLIFYAGIFTFLGFAYTDSGDNNYLTNNGSSININTDTSENLTWSFSNIILNIEQVPLWVNTIIFAPIALIIGFIIITTFIPGANGGS